MPRHPEIPVLTPEQRRQLTRLSLAGGPTATRARIILELSKGNGQPAVAKLLRISVNMVSRWSTRFRRHGIEGLRTAPKAGRPRVLDHLVDELCSAKLGEVTATAQRLGIARSTATRLRSEHPELIPNPDLHILPPAPTDHTDVLATLRFARRPKRKFHRPKEKAP